MTSLERLIDELLEMTKESSIMWVERNSIFTSDTNKFFEYVTEDKKTSFEVDIKLDKDFKISKTSLGNKLRIKNDDIIDDGYTIYASESDAVMEIIEILKQKYITKNQSDQEAVFESILNTIGDKRTRRNKKLEKILKPHVESEKQEKEKEKKSLIKRIFKL